MRFTNPFGRRRRGMQQFQDEVKQMDEIETEAVARSLDDEVRRARERNWSLDEAEFDRWLQGSVEPGRRRRQKEALVPDLENGEGSEGDGLARTEDSEGG